MCGRCSKWFPASLFSASFLHSFCFSSLTPSPVLGKRLWMPCHLAPTSGSLLTATSIQPSWIHFLLEGAEPLHLRALMYTLSRFSRNIPGLKFCDLGPWSQFTLLLLRISLHLFLEAKILVLGRHPVAWWFYRPFSVPVPFPSFLSCKEEICSFPGDSPGFSLLGDARSSKARPWAFH